MVKEFGLMVFMAGVGLSAGSGIGNGLGAVGGQMLIAGLVVSLVPVIICFLFGAYVLRMNHALFFGAMMGARTCAPAMEMISEHGAQQHSGIRLCGNLCDSQRSVNAGGDTYCHHLAGLRIKLKFAFK